MSHEPRIRSAPAEIRRVAGPPPPHPPSDCLLSQGVAMCRGSRTPTRETRRVRSKRVPGRASDQHPLHQTRRRPATAAPVPGTRRSVPRPSPLPALVALRFQVHPTVDVPGLSPRTEVSSADSEAQAAHPLSPSRTRTRRRPTVFALVVGPILLDVEIPRLPFLRARSRAIQPLLNQCAVLQPRIKTSRLSARGLMPDR